MPDRPTPPSELPLSGKRGHRVLRVTAWLLGVLVLLVAALVVFAVSFDWNRAKPYVERQVYEATGRQLHIDGPLALSWQRGQDGETGWRGWVPSPQLTAQGLRFSNADWSRSGQDMAQLASLRVSLDPLPLLKHTVRITTLALEGPQVSLERRADGLANWAFQPPDQKPDEAASPSNWTLELGRVILHQGNVHYADAPLQIDLTVKVDDMAPQEAAVGPYAIRWSLDGRYRQAKLEGDGRTGAVLDLRDEAMPFPVQAHIRAGRTHAEIEGTLLKPTALAGLDLKLALAGQSMADLYALSGINLPKTPPYKTQGRLIGRVAEGGSKSWTYQGFSGQVGQSDIEGTLEYVLRPARPLLRGQVKSKLLRFEDLGPLVGAGPSTSQSEFDDTAQQHAQPTGRVLPVTNFDTQSWGAMDADVRFDGERIVRAGELPITSVHAVVKLDDRVLSLTPLNFGVAGGTLGSTIHLDARNGAIVADTRASLRQLRLAQLFPKLETMHASLGQLKGDVVLKGKGNNVAALLGTSNGEVEVLVSKGTLSKFMLEAMGLNIGSIVMTQLFGDRQIELNCLASRFDVKDGLMNTRFFVLDTSESRVEISGTVNLKTEQLALDIVPRNKQLRLVSLRAPLHVKGTFANPDVGIDKTMVALKLGAAAALYTAAPFAALLPLTSVNLGNEEEVAGCRTVVEGPAGKSAAAPAPR